MGVLELIEKYMSPESPIEKTEKENYESILSGALSHEIEEINEIEKSVEETTSLDELLKLIERGFSTSQDVISKIYSLGKEKQWSEEILGDIYKNSSILSRVNTLREKVRQKMSQVR